MRIAVLTIFPEMLSGVLSASILGRAREEGLLAVEAVDIRPYSTRKHKNTDDYPFGGGAGMVMTAQPIVDAVEDLRRKGYTGKCLYMSPRGETLTQQKAMEIARREDNLIILCGHYEGVDQRAIDLVADEEISIGDFVLTGGELPALVLIDAVARHLPGVLGSGESAQDESFSDETLEYPQYTRPRVFRGMEVPEVLLSGNHAQIGAWRKEQALQITRERRPDLLDGKE
jgi:tRNA (guanine37-N1)-methyltransferase